MSLYRNLGPISFNSETQFTQIFETDKCWLIQLKPNIRQLMKITEKQFNNNQGQNPIKWLQKQAERLNANLNSNVMCVYNENGKTPSLLLKKENVTKWNFQNNKNIQLLCLICRALLNAFQQTQGLLGLKTKIEKQLFFTSNMTHEIFYLNIPQFHLDKQKTNEQIQIQKAIISFLEQNFSFKSNISNKLLLKKLKKCQKITEVKQQLKYFENVYEIGRKKMKEQINDRDNIEQSFQKQNSLIKNHRKYRKRSQEVFQQKEVKHQIFTKLCSEHRNSTVKKQISLANEKRISQSTHNHKQQSLSFFTNRNTNSKAFHSSYSDLKQHFKNTTRSKGLFSTSRSNHKSYKLSLNNYKQKNTTKVGNPGKLNYRNSLSKQKDQEQIKKEQRMNEQKQKGVLKQQLNNHLQEWKQKRLRSNAWLNQQKNKRQSKENLKQIRRKHKGQAMNYGDMEIHQPPTHFCQELSNKKIKNKTFQSTKMISIENQIKQPQFETQLKKLVTNPDQEETMRNNFDKESSIKKITAKKQSITRKQPINVTQKEVFKEKQREKEKQKTKRKPTNPSEVLEQSVIKNLKEKLERINYVGQCVTNMPKYLSNVKSGQKFFWQLPAFVIYKQFYSRRLEIQENLRSQCRCLNIEKGEIINFMKQMEQQNKEAKQSLIKLLKTGLKKLKKYQVDSATLNAAKHAMNLQFPFNTKRNHDMIGDFIGDVEEMRTQKPELLSPQIQIIDALFILKSLNFDIEKRKKINVDNFTHQDTIAYFSSRYEQICHILNEGA